MTVKTAISLPKEQFMRLERLRKMQGISRSAFIHKVIDQWLKNTEEQKLVGRYIRGYMSNPESVGELQAMSQAAAEAFREESLK